MGTQGNSRIVHSRFTICILAILLVYNAICGVYFLPALPSMAISLSSSRKLAELAVPISLLGVLTSQLLFGYMSDKFNKKIFSLVMLPIFIVGVLLSGLANNIVTFLIGIFFQGTMTTTYTTCTAWLKNISKDINLRFFAKISMLRECLAGCIFVFTGFVVTFLGWRAVFYSIAAACLILWFLLFFVESAPYYKDSAKASIIERFNSLIRNPVYAKFTIASSALNAANCVFLTLLPFLIIHDFGIKPNVFGLMLLIPTLGGIIGSYLTSYLANKIAKKFLLLISFIIGITTCIGFIISSHFVTVSALDIMILGFFYFFAVSMTTVTSEVSIISISSVLSGFAASLLSVFLHLSAAFSGFLGAHFLNEYMGVFMLSINLTGAVFFYILDRY